MRNRLIAFTALLLVAALSSGAAPKISGIYSNLEYNEEGGDLLGYEILIIPTREGWRAVVQVAEGGPAVPFVAAVTVDGSRVEFPIPDDFGGGTFVGEVTATELKGSFGAEEIRLPRGRSYWQ